MDGRYKCMSADKIYQQVAAYLKQSIASGELKIGDAIYSENLLCEKLGVSRTSVRKAIRLMIEENILVSRQGKGTFVKGNGGGVLHNALCLVNHYTRAMRYDVTDHYYTDIIYSTERATREHEMEFQIFSRVIRTAEEALERFSKLKFDGLLVDGYFQNHFEELDFFRRISPNLVVVDGHPGETGLPVAAPDTKEGFRLLLGEAVRRGGPVAFLYHDQQSLHRWRADGFRAAAEELGVRAEWLNYGQNITADNFLNLDHYLLIHDTLRPWLAPEHFGGTVFCSCDYGAAKALQVLKRYGYHAPEDFAVAGFGGVGFSCYTEPEITTVKVDSDRLGQKAVELLIDQINGAVPPGKDFLLPVGLLKRGSL